MESKYDNRPYSFAFLLRLARARIVHQAPFAPSSQIYFPLNLDHWEELFVRHLTEWYRRINAEPEIQQSTPCRQH